MDSLDSRWTCPQCDREFGRTRQSHVCVPGGTVDDTFAGRPPEQRAIYEAVVRHLRTLGPLHIDAVRVGVFLKHRHTLAELRPMARALSMNLVLPRRVDDPRVVRTMRVSGDRLVHVFRLRAVDEVDDALRALLSEAYDAAR